MIVLLKIVGGGYLPFDTDIGNRSPLGSHIQYVRCGYIIIFTIDPSF